jgi:hypothetical protein
MGGTVADANANSKIILSISTDSSSIGPPVSSSPYCNPRTPSSRKSHKKSMKSEDGRQGLLSPMSTSSMMSNLTEEQDDLSSHADFLSDVEDDLHAAAPLEQDQDWAAITTLYMNDIKKKETTLGPLHPSTLGSPYYIFNHKTN